MPTPPQHSTQPHKARKRFGQNFLVDQGMINHIVRSIAVKPTDNMVEIGPGQGAITGLVLQTCPHLHVVELDRDLIPRLEEQFSQQYPQFTIHQGDALKFDFGQLVNGDAPLRIIGNLPYNISTPLIFHLLSYKHAVQDMHFMLQKEVVVRMGASPGEKNYGRLSVLTQYHCLVESLFDVAPECFRPIPKVDSAIVRLIPHKEKPVVANNEKTLDTVVKAAFSQRRKTLRNALKNVMPETLIESVGINPTLRAENLCVEEFVSLANRLDSDLSHATED